MQPTTDHARMALTALEFLQDAKVNIQSPFIENAMAVRQWLAAIMRGELVVGPPSTPEPEGRDVPDAKGFP